MTTRSRHVVWIPLILACTSGVSVPAANPISVSPGLRLDLVDELCADDDGPDTDEDGLSDDCELGIGRSFAPVLVVADRGCNMDSTVHPPRLGGEYYFGVQPVGLDAAVRIAYLPAYYRDCGWRGIKCWLPFVSCAPHTGDSEMIIVEVERDAESQRWRTRAIFLSAHCFGRSTANCRWYRGADLAGAEWYGGQTGGAPVVWVAEGRQANYLSRSRCDGGHSTIDTCDHNHLRYRFPIEMQRQNIGSRKRPVGAEGGCVDTEHIGWGSRLADAGVVECFWDIDRQFRGWQADTTGTPATPYARYLDEIAGFVPSTFPSARTEAPDTERPPRLRIADNGRRIVVADGSPFIWLADTAWELFHRLNRDEADIYLEDRARKGFNIIQAVVLAEQDGLHVPNPEGHVPLLDDDPTRPNEAYFEHVDYIVAKAAELGIYIGMLPTWGDKFNRAWGIGPEVFTPDNARVYGEFLGERYKEDPIIWIVGGDRNPESDEHIAIIRALAKGIRAANGGRQLMTYHPAGGRKSWEWFARDAWLDIHLFQSGHSERDLRNDRMTAEGYGVQPVKPVIDGEPRYEDHPVDWDAEHGWFDAFDIRQAAYWSVLAGAAGHTYGNHNIWQMWEPGRTPISAARTPWREALSHPGAAQMGFMKRLFLSRPFLELVPDQSAVTGGAIGEATADAEGADQGADAILAARDARGRFLVAYTPYGRPIEIDLSTLSGDRLRAWWFDPRTGVATPIGPMQGGATQQFDPPGDVARGNDWVLVVDDAAQAYAAPGTVLH